MPAKPATEIVESYRDVANRRTPILDTGREEVTDHGTDQEAARRQPPQPQEGTRRPTKARQARKAPAVKKAAAKKAPAKKAAKR